MEYSDLLPRIKSYKNMFYMHGGCTAEGSLVCTHLPRRRHNFCAVYLEEEV